MKATDHAMGSFLKQFFTSKMASDTLLVIAGDHGASIYPGFRELAGVTKDLLWSRILLGVFVPGQKIGRTINYPVNQIDIAPMIASIIGIKPHPAWLGRNPLEGSGSPWVKKTGMHGITYRTPERYCSTKLNSETIKCLRMKKNSDPFFTRPEVIPDDPKQTHLLRQVIQASDSLLGSLGPEGPNS